MAETATMSDAPVFRMNPAINARDYAEIFRRDGVVQIHNFFEPALADHLEATLKDNTYWRLTYSDANSRAKSLTAEELPKVDLQALAAEVLKRAGDGFAYVYLACHLQQTYGGAPDHPLHKLFTVLNTPEFLAFGRDVTGHHEVVRADAAATWYRPGDFLTMHDDEVGLRRVAYTLGFSRGWRGDWGGQLLFHTRSGDVNLGLMPTFNVLTMFDIPRRHSVSQVAHYAKERRLTISGWLFAPPPPAAST